MFSIKGKFVWLSGKPFTYTSWKTGKPNSALNEKCVGVHTTWDFGWNDDHCNKSNYKSTTNICNNCKYRPLCMLSTCYDPGKKHNKRIITIFVILTNPDKLHAYMYFISS